MQLLTIPSNLCLCSGSKALKETMEPSLNPINASESFLCSLRRMLVGKLPREIFWNVYVKSNNYDSFHVVSEVYVLTFLGNGEIGFVQDLTYSNFYESRGFEGIFLFKSFIFLF